LHEVTAQVLDVTGRKSKNGQHTMYDVALSDGNKYTTFDAGTANTAAALKGQVVTAHVEVKQNGKYTNYDLEAIAPQGQLAPAPVAAGTAVTVPVTPTVSIANGTTPTPDIPIAAASNGRTPEFARGAALNSAIAFIATGAADTRDGEGSHELVARYTRAFQEFADTGKFPWEGEATTPQEVAAAVPGVQVGVVEQPAKTGVQW
jgi:hypothetical protein